MSLYLCPACGFTDNTAGSGFHEQRRVGVARPVCSSCNPDVEASSTRLLNLRPEELVSDPIPDLLRRAVAKLDQLNRAATAAPWSANDDGQGIAGSNGTSYIGEFLAPADAALAVVLREATVPLILALNACADDHGLGAPWGHLANRNMLEIARAILVEEEPRG